MKCELCENDKCRATSLFCFRENKPDRWCVTYLNAYKIGYIDGVNKCIERVRNMKNAESVCEDNAQN